MTRIIRLLFSVITFPVFSILFLFLAIVARFVPKKTDVGIGPEPLINNIYHKKALEKAGYTAETYASHLYFITVSFDVLLWKANRFVLLKSYLFFIRNLFTYKVLYFYFNGGPLAWTSLKYLEAFYYKIAKIKTVVLPYGGDIQQNQLTPNLIYRNAYTKDYPQFQKTRNFSRKLQTMYWQRFANFVLAGCDWVDYLYHWDKLVLAHFCTDVSEKPNFVNMSPSEPIVVLHAPNHEEIKGTKFLMQAIKNLQNKGLPVQLQIVRKVSNSELRQVMSKADIIVDQLVIGWYGMFAVEAMSLGKPVVANMREDLVSLYVAEGLLTDANEVPVIHSDIFKIEKVLEKLILEREKLNQHGQNCYKFFERHHSIEAMAEHLKEINFRVLGK